ncbi:hypothetical protein [Paenibacillus anseongense]|uniref:hypothetical protein n=1 Tax=Paenibacillus anseongense TaxID=2682845 RepID=UPI002DB99DA0|nr:hypothetical protein [Paenibacillus anseongense]MEC0271419.1 hypothetical protein [Paenibacillus anseongense]
MKSHSEDGYFYIDEVALIDRFEDSTVAMKRYYELHREHLYSLPSVHIFQFRPFILISDCGCLGTWNEKGMMSTMTTTGLTFGIYPLSVAGTPTGLAIGPKDDYGSIQLALNELRGSKQLFPRNYLVYTGPESEPALFSFADRLLQFGLLGDLTAGCMQETDIDMDRWLDFIRKIIRKYGAHLASLQITNEPNLSFMEGSKPYTLQALVEGVKAAKQEVRDQGLQVQIGFGSVPEGPMAVPHFWEGLAELGGRPFLDALDFVGHNFYVDVFEEPLHLDEIADSVERTLRNLRESSLIKAGIPATIPIRVTENGWPTGQNPFTQNERTYEQQASVLERVIRTVYGLHPELHITHYELFGLRDADSSNVNIFYQFGILRDDYSEKPAYATFKRLILELGS